MWPTFYIPVVPPSGGSPPVFVTRFYLTTPPYPIEITDSIESTVTPIGGYQSTLDQETFESSAAFLSGTLVTRLLLQEQPEDEYQSEAAFISGVLTVRLLLQEQPEDECQSEAAFLSGDLRRILISYTNWPLLIADESIESSAAFLSGDMT